ncbi:hypothetical protein CEXT_158881 [Caerostris extrusa]|uniref:Uncharacterized protein n=1 Tax=Caerostris extrusa TaxID=172846 RepID=A0AAV4SU93_CAEEX|nr:hypothetical protein CEXT_158881 [Caerostris extrusa]
MNDAFYKPGMLKTSKNVKRSINGGPNPAEGIKGFYFGIKIPGILSGTLGTESIPLMGKRNSRMGRKA